MHAPIIVDELSMDDFLNPKKLSLAQSMKAKYYEWNSEYNIKKTVFVVCIFYVVQNI